VTFDAVPDLERTGTVVGIAPTGTDIQGVTSYYATIVLNELDPRLMDGQTASANVIVDQLDDTLVVPNAAILQSGQSGVVTVLDPDGSHRQVQVELGLAGDSVTQVVAGLHEGQQIVVAPGE
jgi:multidrug efflux pump subunit AcrA (membrane-fusion protein)